MSDPSAFSVVAGFALFLALVFALAAALLWTARRFQTPARASGQRKPSPARGSTRQQCSTTGCGYPASALVVESQDLGGATRLVCKGCADEGAAHRWWEFVGDAS